MKIDFTKELLVKVLACQPIVGGMSEEGLSELRKKMSYGSKVEYDIATFTIEQLNAFKEIAIEFGDRGLSNRLASLINLKNNPMNAKIGTLKALPVGLATFMMHKPIKGWLFRREDDGTDLPWLLLNVEYHGRTAHSADYCLISLMANTAKSSTGRTKDSRDINVHQIYVRAEDIYKKTIGQLLDKVGLVKETAELHSHYESELELFINYRAKVNEQFITNQSSVSIDDSETSYWSRNRARLTVAAGHKLVNDESLIERYVTSEHLSKFWQELANNSEMKFDQVPFHCKMYLYNLTLHQHHWTHVSFVNPYKYKPELKEKLVLPQNHHDLVEILASDMGFIMDDIIDGKSGGTTILCKGSPGLGKTLTAEVYSEVIAKPLYRVHSGQLGTTAKEVEDKLNAVLARASRWGAVMLIDEADVFIRARGNDIEHNAVVAAFLRTLEYFDGLLFMTTNRSDDIDDAILSRCIAVIKFELPTKEDAHRIWGVLSAQFNNSLSKELITHLTEKYPKASGRDIKELLKLTLKFCKGKGIAVDADAFRSCAMFRGLA